MSNNTDNNRNNQQSLIRRSTTTTTTFRIRKRPVSFGNPALGTYHGFVYTITHGPQAGPTTNCLHRSTKNGSNNNTHPPRPLIEGAVDVHRITAMVDVPPEQVPEGVLNLARPHIPWIDHVRIVIADHTSDDENGHLVDISSNEEEEEESADETNKTTITSAIIPLSPTATAMENAASILAQEQQRGMMIGHSNNKNDHENTTRNRKPQRTYLVLFELCTEEAAEMFVEDLHGKPYTFLDETVTCSVYHVAALQGEDGVSLMSPFFAPSKNQSLELLPSHASDNSSTSSTTKRITAPTSSNTPSNTSSVLDGATTTSGTHTTNSKFSSSRAEDYNCAVCLEHMDLDRPIITPTANYQAEDALASPRTSILTTVCNHTFHLDCLLQWQDSPCPVCRYDHSGLNETLSQCHVCGTTENNYVCLICGLVSCGGRGTIGATSITADNPNSMSSHANRQFDVASRLPSHDDDDDNDDQTDCRSRHKNNPDRIMDVSTSSTSSSQQNRRPLARGSHAWDHYEKTLHAYALNTETQHVWDFAGQGYVHRLLQNKEDGKLVEVNDPRNTTSHERSTSPGLTEAQEGEVVHRKLEGFASQYYTLLKSQLEQQRIFYQGRLEEIRREYSDTYNNKQRRPQSTDLISALKHEKHQLNHRLNSLQSKCRKVKDDVAFLKSMNESLEVNRETVRCQIEHAQRDRVKARKMFEDCLPPLQEKVTRLMLQLENHDSNTIEDKPAAV